MTLQRRRRPRELITIALLIATVSVTWWWLESAQKEKRAPAPAAIQQPDAFFDNFTLTTMSQTGQPSHRLTGERMNHFPATNTAELIAPRLLIFEADDAPWDVTARTAVVQLDKDTVWLLGDVRAERKPPDGPPLVIETSDLFVEPNRNYTETSQVVTVRHAQGVTTGLGLQGWLDEKRFTLLAQVRGQYEPPVR